MAERSSKIGAWIVWILMTEILLWGFSLKAYSPHPRRRRLDLEGNFIARSVLDDPGFWTSMLLYVVIFHLLILGLWGLARIAGRGKDCNRSSRG